jgi:hypothetical protein
MGADLPTVTSEEPLLSYIRRHLDAGGRFAPGGVDLPDEATSASTGLRWAPGALDGVVGHHGGRGDHVRNAQNVAEVLVKVCRRPTRRRLRSLHRALVEADTLAIVDLLLEELTRLRPDVDAVRRVGLWLARTSPNRGPVKVGLALLGRLNVLWAMLRDHTPTKPQAPQQLDKPFENRFRRIAASRRGQRELSDANDVDQEPSEPVATNSANKTLPFEVNRTRTALFGFVEDAPATKRRLGSMTDRHPWLSVGLGSGKGLGGVLLQVIRGGFGLAMRRNRRDARGAPQWLIAR